MALNQAILGFVFSQAAGTSVNDLKVSGPTHKLVGAMEQMVLPNKTLTRYEYRDPVGVTRNGATTGAELLRLTGQLRIWDWSITTMFGTTKAGDMDFASLDLTADGGITKFKISMNTSGYHTKDRGAGLAAVEFGGLWDSMPAVTMDAENNTVSVPFGVELLTYKEYFTYKSTPSADPVTMLGTDIDVDNMKWLVRRTASTPASLTHGTNAEDIWKSTRLSLGFAS